MWPVSGENNNFYIDARNLLLLVSRQQCYWSKVIINEKHYLAYYMVTYWTNQWLDSQCWFQNDLFAPPKKKIVRSTAYQLLELGDINVT